MAAPTCLVVGSSGLIGAALCESLAKTREVVGLSRRAHAIHGRFTWQFVDLNEAVDVSCLPAKVDSIVYLAQSDRFRDFPNKAVDIFEVNTVNLLRILDYGRQIGVKRFLFASS